jgi:hypothetical protein
MIRMCGDIIWVRGLVIEVAMNVLSGRQKTIVFYLLEKNKCTVTAIDHSWT